VHRGEAANTNFVAFGFTQDEIEPTIFRTRSKHADHYTTNAF